MGRETQEQLFSSAWGPSRPRPLDLGRWPGPKKSASEATHISQTSVSGDTIPRGRGFLALRCGFGGQGRPLSFSSPHESCALGHRIYRARPREARSPAAQVKRSFSGSKEAKGRTQDPFGLAQFGRVLEGEHQG